MDHCLVLARCVEVSQGRAYFSFRGAFKGRYIEKICTPRGGFKKGCDYLIYLKVDMILNREIRGFPLKWRLIY